MRKGLTLGYCIILLGLISNEAFGKDSEPVLNSFKFALPEGYQVISHSLTPQYSGGSAVLMSSETSAGDTSEKKKIIRVQTYLKDSFEPKVNEERFKKPKELLEKLITSQLDAFCSEYTYDSGRVRREKHDVRVNWWVSCKLAGQQEAYEYERGRMFMSETGVYILSHSNQNSDPNHRISSKEKLWFDTYLYRSGVCTLGKDCSNEGALVTGLFRVQ